MWPRLAQPGITLVQAKEEVWRLHCAANGLDSLPGVRAEVTTSAQPAVEAGAVGAWVAGKLRQMWATDAYGIT